MGELTRDDLGTPFAPDQPCERIVSLVPSLTEAVAVSAPGRLVGATDWCSHPPDLDVARVKGTKWPDIDRIRSLHPDLVLANAEENRPQDIAALREAGIAVWVTAPATVPEALTSLGRMLATIGLAEPGWLTEARSVWAAPAPAATTTAIVPIWRRPWMVLGRDTFAGDVLRRLGVDNAYNDHPERYPTIDIDDLRAESKDLVVLPDEPYAFSASDGPEAFPDTRCALVSGRHLTWYGPCLVEARAILTDQLAASQL